MIQKTSSKKVKKNLTFKSYLTIIRTVKKRKGLNYFLDCDIVNFTQREQYQKQVLIEVLDEIQTSQGLVASTQAIKKRGTNYKNKKKRKKSTKKFDF